MPPKKNPLPTLTPLQCHLAKWKTGCGNTICQMASRIVIGRGTLPADVLFLGEAPGISEDTLGRPFVGPAGKLLDSIIQHAKTTTGTNPTIALTNLVGCIPRIDAGKPQYDEPTIDEIHRCKGRLGEFVKLARPKVIVAVGRLAESWAMKFFPEIRLHSIQHPAAILRMNVTHQGLAFEKAAVAVAEAFEAIGQGPIVTPF